MRQDSAPADLSSSLSSRVLQTWNEPMRAIIIHKEPACFASVGMGEGRWQGLHSVCELCLKST